MKHKDSINELFTMFATLTNNEQVDVTIKERLLELIGKDEETIKTGLLSCINDGVENSLIRDHEVKGLKLIYEKLLDCSTDDYTHK